MQRCRPPLRKVPPLCPPPNFPQPPLAAPPQLALDSKCSTTKPHDGRRPCRPPPPRDLPAPLVRISPRSAGGAGA